MNNLSVDSLTLQQLRILIDAVAIHSAILRQPLEGHPAHDPYNAVRVEHLKLLRQKLWAVHDAASK
jgi:hypothetical protein